MAIEDIFPGGDDSKYVVDCTTEQGLAKVAQAAIEKFFSEKPAGKLVHAFYRKGPRGIIKGEDCVFWTGERNLEVNRNYFDIGIPIPMRDVPVDRYLEDGVRLAYLQFFDCMQGGYRGAIGLEVSSEGTQIGRYDFQERLPVELGIQ
jgi:hypothetical protein